MCGIFGIVSAPGVDPDALWFGTHRARHRGPDDWGFAALAPVNATQPSYQLWRTSTQRWVASNFRVGLGSRRLSVLDLSEAGRQPMNLRGSDLWIVFNGEIYNYLELRAQLSADHCFSTQTDTEVLLAAYQKWGPECLRRLNGMFAFAIFDATRMRLFMARDRFGERPFYYLWNNGQFAFASEIKQFFEYSYWSREVDRSALADFLLLSTQDHDERTFLKNIKQLRPAHWMELDLSTQRLSAPVPYWIPDVADDLDQSHDREFEQSFAATLEDSVRLRLRSDVPVGICLSGGIDSSTIASIAVSQRSSSDLTAYTMSFPRYSEDESYLARCMAKHADIRLVESSCDAGELWEGLKEFVYLQDGPVGGASLFASAKIFREARNDGTTVLLNGQGCDEYFAGYSKFFFFWWEVLFARCRWLQLAGSVMNYAARNGSIHWNLVNARRYFPRSLQRKVRSIHQFALSDFQRDAAELDVGHGGSLNRRLWKDLSEFSLPCLLHWEDRNSMAAGTEARLPFLDHRLVEAVLKTSAHTKLRAGFTKYSLRQAMNAQLPAEICWQKLKRGFETPARRWFRNELASPFEHLLLKKDSPLAEFFDMKGILGAFRGSLNSARVCLTEFDCFKLATTELWLRELSHVARTEEAALSA